MDYQTGSDLPSNSPRITLSLQFPPACVRPPATTPEYLKLPVQTISLLTDDQLNNLENNYRRKNKTVGGKWTLQQAFDEKQLRLADENDPESLLRVIVANSRRSSDIRTTYADVYRAIRPNKKWTGNSSQRIVNRALHNVIKYCVANNLPIATSLVVQTATRQLTQDAIENIYNTARSLDCDVGLNAYNFVARQIALSRQLVRILH